MGHTFYWDSRRQVIRLAGKDRREWEASPLELKQASELVCQILMKPEDNDHIRVLAQSWVQVVVSSYEYRAPADQPDSLHSLLLDVCTRPFLVTTVLHCNEQFHISNENFDAVQEAVVDTLLRAIYFCYLDNIDPFPRMTHPVGSTENHLLVRDRDESEFMSPSSTMDMRGYALRFTFIRFSQLAKVGVLAGRPPTELLSERIDMLNAALALERFKIEIPDVLNYLTDPVEWSRIKDDIDGKGSVVLLIPFLLFNTPEKETVATGIRLWCHRLRRSITTENVEEKLEMVDIVCAWLADNFGPDSGRDLNQFAQGRVALMFDWLANEADMIRERAAKLK